MSVLMLLLGPFREIFSIRFCGLADRERHGMMATYIGLLLVILPFASCAAMSAPNAAAAASKPTAKLLSALSPLGFAGFDATAAQRREVAEILDDLATVNPNPKPAEDLSGSRTLIHT